MASEPKYPVYIISKGRAYDPMTAKIFKSAGIRFFIVVEPQESGEYIDAVGLENVLITPFFNLGLGSYPARNFCWEHSINAGFTKHWIFDDNILCFMKWIDGRRRKILNINDALKYVEIYSDKNNVDICGFEECNFCQRIPKKAFKKNVHVYSAMLIKNKIPFRWRLKYNEDVDLCLQVLHNGGSTASCVYYMADKVSTVKKMKGGNQTELYKGNDPIKKLLKAKMLERVWPQYAKTVIRFNRIHHFVNWNIFKKNPQK
jgi:hypothetical protein